MHILRILEIAWLCIAICLFGIALFQYFSEDIGAAAFMLVGTVIASCMYFIRKKQRLKIGRQQSTDASVNYH